MSTRTLPASMCARYSRSAQHLLSILSQSGLPSRASWFVSLCLLCDYGAAQEVSVPVALEQASTVVIFGQGQTRQVQNITRSDLAKALPGSSPLKTLEKLPGVSFQSADAFGAYEWSTRFSVRGFSQGQLGFQKIRRGKNPINKSASGTHIKGLLEGTTKASATIMESGNST